MSDPMILTSAMRDLARLMDERKAVIAALARAKGRVRTQEIARLEAKARRVTNTLLRFELGMQP